MRVISAESTDLFVGPEDAPLQLVTVRYEGGQGEVRIDGDGISGAPVVLPGDAGIAEVPVIVDDPVPGLRRAAQARTDDGVVDFEFTVAEPRWTMFMVSHFHYDPVWWNTQAAYTSVWTEEPLGAARQTNSFNLVRAHLDMARRVPEYKFVLAEVDYLKPYWDVHPEDRAELRQLIAEGRVEIMGGTYNEPNTNLTDAETTVRNFVAGIGFQRDILGARPATAWQLDAFGHDPQFPGMAADAGLTASSWARGPHHQWGPMQHDGDPLRMQFSSEFEWISPSGLGVITHYMPAHYSAGWWMDSSATLADAEAATHRLFQRLAPVAATRNVLLPVGTDYTPPNKWVTEIHRDWNTRYTWPRFVCATPAEFFGAVRAELDATGAKPSPQTRDMNPIYTGKDVSYIDTKQANRAAEHAVLDAERFAVFAGLLGGTRYPEAALAKAWVQLAYGAHHDAITGSESDQVYLDLLTTWRDAWELGSAGRDNALDVLSSAVSGGDVVVWNTMSHTRTDIVTMHVTDPVAGAVVRTADGVECPTLVDDDGHTVRWLAHDVPSTGWRAYRLGAGGGERWQPVDGCEIANDHFRVTVDGARGGGVSSMVDIGSGRELIASGRVGNELAVYEEYPAHPEAGEGPWHLLPRGPVVASSSGSAEVTAYRCALGSRLVIRGRIAELLRYTQTVTLWHGLPRIDCQTVIDDFAGVDQLVRLRWPCPVPGALPVSEVGDAVVGRGFALLHDPADPRRSVDTARHPWTLDNPAFGWFGLSSAVRVRVGADVRAVSVAEVVAPTEAESSQLARDLMVALVRAGVTATCSGAARARYGDLAVDSNLPDTRISIGGPEHNEFTAAVLAAADPEYSAELVRQLDATGSARVWVPASAALAARWIPDADLKDVLALPVLITAGEDLGALVLDLADAEIEVTQQAPSGVEVAEHRTVAVLNRGVPSFAVETDGTLTTSLMRSCTGWPSGTWIDPPRRTLPDGANFGLQHWTHTFDYAIVAGEGDWRAADVPKRSAEFSRPLIVVPTASDGALPPSGALLEPCDGVHVAACKAAGNPTPTGRSAAVDPRAVTLRLVEAYGRTASVDVSSAVARIGPLVDADLLEDSRSGSVDRLHGYQIATVLTTLDAEELVDARERPLAPEAEAAQPLYARYWLHNRGPAPLGGLPAVAHLHPQRVDMGTDTELSVRLTAASDCTDAELSGTVRVLCPAGWSATPAELPLDVPAGDYVETQITVTRPGDAEPGLYPLRAQLALTGDVPDAWRQTVEDVCVVSLGATDDVLLTLVDEPEPVELHPGQRSRLSVAVGTDARADLAVEAHVISPWGTWEWIGPAAVGAVLPARGSVEIGFDVAPPPWTTPGQWWALIRVGCAGHLLYTSAVSVVVR